MFEDIGSYFIRVLLFEGEKSGEDYRVGSWKRGSGGGGGWGVLE